MHDLSKLNKKHLAKSDIQNLYAKVNGVRDWQIDVNSDKLIDRIIELWFETQGYDFWHNPYPQVQQWEVTDEKEIIFYYGQN